MSGFPSGYGLLGNNTVAASGNNNANMYYGQQQQQQQRQYSQLPLQDAPPQHHFHNNNSSSNNLRRQNHDSSSFREKQLEADNLALQRKVQQLELKLSNATAKLQRRKTKQRVNDDDIDDDDDNNNNYGTLFADEEDDDHASETVAAASRSSSSQPSRKRRRKTTSLLKNTGTGGNEDRPRIVVDGRKHRWDANFEERIKVLTEYREKHGNLEIKKREGKAGWVHQEFRKQYKRYQKGEQSPLDPERVQRLEALGMTWQAEDVWGDNYERLKKFRTEYGHCCVQAVIKKNDEQWDKFARWANNQRRQLSRFALVEDTMTEEERRKRARDYSLNPEKRKLLADLDCLYFSKETFRLDTRDPKAAKTTIADPQAKETENKRKRGGDTEHPDAKRKRGVSVASAKKGGRDDKKWGRTSVLWYRYLEELRAFKQKHGHPKVPYAKQGLPRWIRVQRSLYTEYKDGKKQGDLLTMTRVRLLNDVGFPWEASFEHLI